MTKNVMQIKTRQERELYSEWKNVSTKHSSYGGKKKYYPNRMDEWEQENKEIDASYRGQLHEMISAREMVENETNVREVELEAAEALLLLRKRANQEKARREVRKELNEIIPRRSSRIAKKESCYI